MRICFDLGGVFYPGAADMDNAQVLQALLEALVVADMVYLRRFPRTPALYASGVRYRRTQVWDSIPDLYARKYGDCKSLTAARVAELRVHGERVARPVFRFAKNPMTGHKDFHILVQRASKQPNGSLFEDPSRVLGMDQYNAQRGLWSFPAVA